MKLSEFDYSLPKELIAQYPATEREKCRLMVLDRKTGEVFHKEAFDRIVGYFNKGDCIVLNDTKVIPARLFGKRKSGGSVEIFLLEKKNPVCEALIRSSARLKEGETIYLESGDEAKVLQNGGIGRFIGFSRLVDDILNEIGHVPLPPYIDRTDQESDRYDYQTVYAKKEGATASPTAGLHFTKELLDRVAGNGVRVTYLTLHTSYGTFAPIKTQDIEEHKMHKEYFELPQETAEIINETKKNGGRVFAVGTTSARVLEHCSDKLSTLPVSGASSSRLLAHSPKPLPEAAQSSSGYTDLFIYPGFDFKIVDGLITNFHLPKSTLLLLVSAFAGKDLIFEAYRQAIERKYRFFSYGDAMLIV